MKSPKAVSATSDTLLWHDYETFGISSEHDRPSQFAHVRTDLALNVIDQGTSFYCQPGIDYLPEPTACMLTGITPQLAHQQGLPEPEFARLIHAQLSQPGTTSCGYNSMRFDEEFTRQLLWRNFFPVYEREFQHQNARFDLIDLVRMAYALRPDGLVWPTHDDKPSFKLENLSAANGLRHESAHDAHSDVLATVALAQKLKSAQPQLWEHGFALRRKAAVQKLIDLGKRTPLVHVSQRFRAERGCLAIWLPICMHPAHSNEVIGIDLSDDPTPWLSLSAEEIAERIYVRQADLPEGETRVLIKTVHLNRAPMLAPLGVLNKADHARIQLDLSMALEHAALLQKSDHIAPLLRAVFQQPKSPLTLGGGLYDGFVGPGDQALCRLVRELPPERFIQITDRFSDPRLTKLFLAYRARHFPDQLNLAEQEAWRLDVQKRLHGAAPMNFERFAVELKLARERARSAEQKHICDQLESYGVALAQTWSSHW